MIITHTHNNTHTPIQQHWLRMRKSRALNQSLMSSYSLHEQSIQDDGQFHIPNQRKLLKILPQMQKPRKIASSHLLDLKVVFTPQSRFIIIWNIINIILIYTYFLQIPIAIAYESQRDEEENKVLFQVINFIAMFILVVGIVVKLKTAFYKEGVLISDAKQVRSYYWRNYFVIELLSIVSIGIYQFLEAFHQAHGPFRWVIILFYLKLPQLLEIQKLLINSFDLNRRVKAFFKLILLLAKIFLICNVGACGFYYLSDYIMQTKGYNDCQNCSWIQKIKFNDTLPVYNMPFGSQYTYSLYWASTTMISIGYGDITPQNQYQISYTVVIQYFSCLLFAYAINQIWSIIQELNSKKDKIHQRMNVINVYMRDKNIDPKLKSKVNAYLSHYYQAKNLREKELEDQIITSLTPQLKKQLFYQSYGSIFRNHPLFNKFDRELQQIASQKVQEVGYFQQQYIYSPEMQHQTLSLYYIKNGEVCTFLGNEKHKIKIKLIDQQATLGLYEFINQVNYLSALQVVKYSSIYRLHFIQWKELLVKYQQDFQKFYQLKHRILLEKEMQLIQYKCYYCRMRNHRTEECFTYGILNLVGNFIKTSKEVNLRKSYLRSNRKEVFLSDFNIIQTERKKYIKAYQTNKTNIARKLSLTINHQADQPKMSPKLTSKRNKVEKKQHFQKIKSIMDKAQFNEDSQQDAYSDISIIKSSELQVDKVVNYQNFFSNYNSDVQIAGALPKKRFTYNNLF